MNNTLERLQKVMASCGVASRRKCEEIILAKRVKVNGVIVDELGFKVSKKDIILVDDKPIAKQDLVYFVLYKPTGYITTVSDDLDRRTVLDLFSKQDRETRIFPVGRLDYDTSGVLILTNDGELAYRLTKSANEIQKTYQVRVDGIITQGAITRLIKGVEIDGVKTKQANVEVLELDKKSNSSLLQITITEGRNREIRKMCESVGFEVKKLKRISFAGITLDGLATGEYRHLKPHEIKVLYSL